MTVPARVRALAAAERLGDVQQIYAPEPMRRRALVWPVVLGLPGIILLPFTILALSNGFGFVSVLSLLLTAVYLGAAGRLLARNVLPAFGSAVYVFEQGFVYRNGRTRWRLWGDSLAFPWDSISEVRASGVRRGTGRAVTWRFAIVGEHGHEAVLTSGMAGMREFVERASSEVTRRLLPKYIARVDVGGSVRIGPFTVSRDGLAKDGEIVSWDQIREVGMSNGILYVDRSDGAAGMSVTAGRIPNVVAFTALAEHVRAAAGRTPGPDV